MGYARAGDVEVALVKLPPSATFWLGLIAAIHPRDVIAFDVTAVASGNKSSERDGEVVAQREKLTALVSQVINEFGVFTVFAS